MNDLYAEALVSLRELIEEARAAGDIEPGAMTLATADAQGGVHARVVLLKGFDERGLVFYSHLGSPKGEELRANPRAALLFHWKVLRNQVQVRIEGRTEQVADAEADAYFASRPRQSQLGAWASVQSETLPERTMFDQRLSEYERRFESQPVPRPPFWSGTRVVPDMLEFWYGAEFRLHERFRYELSDAVWSKRMLYP